jgi:hypothetical protein
MRTRCCRPGGWTNVSRTPTSTRHLRPVRIRGTHPNSARAGGVAEELWEVFAAGQRSLSRNIRAPSPDTSFFSVPDRTSGPSISSSTGTASISSRTRYRRRISGPLLDRMDIQIEVPRVTTRDMFELKGVGADTRETAAMVKSARELQVLRQGVCNARLPISDVARYCTPDDQGIVVLKKATESLRLSARGYHRVLRTARTIADLASEERHRGSTSLRRSRCGNWMAGRRTRPMRCPRRRTTSPAPPCNRRLASRAHRAHRCGRLSGASRRRCPGSRPERADTECPCPWRFEAPTLLCLPPSAHPRCLAHGRRCRSA